MPKLFPILNLGSGISLKRDLMILNPMVLNADVEKSKCVDMVCDAHNLPFREKVFPHSILSHILEHVHNPLRVLKEAGAVTSKSILVKVPNLNHRRTVAHESEDHIYSWSIDSLKHLLKLAYPKAKIDMRENWRFHPSVSIIRRVWFLLFSLPTFQPNELVAKIKMLGGKAIGQQKK